MGRLIYETNPKKIYPMMLEDILKAKKRIYLETYIFDDDKIGRSFRDALLKKAKEGVKVLLLIDSIGSYHLHWNFFNELIDNGGKVKFFRLFKYEFAIFLKNHKRDHRKLLIIDDKIGYIGSMNITESCLEWRESVLRIEDNFIINFYKYFISAWISSTRIYGKRIENYYSKEFEIFADNSSYFYRPTENRFRQLINSARSEILIETPYFIPPYNLRKALSDAVKRGVNVKVIIPRKSDVRIVDLIREKFLGDLHKSGVELYYHSGKMHSKVLVVDGLVIVGSSNFDYRSFRHMFEINVLVNNKKLSSEVKNSFDKYLSECSKFSYEAWKNRSRFKKLIERFLTVVRRYF